MEYSNRRVSEYFDGVGGMYEDLVCRLCDGKKKVVNADYTVQRHLSFHVKKGHITRVDLQNALKDLGFWQMQ